MEGGNTFKVKKCKHYFCQFFRGFFLSESSHQSSLSILPVLQTNSGQTQCVFFHHALLLHTENALNEVGAPENDKRILVNVPL